MKIEEIDRNFQVRNTASLTDAVYYDMHQAPMQRYGLMPDDAPGWCVRMEPEIAAQVNPGVAELNGNTAGGRLRFSTDSDYVVIRCVMHGRCIMPHMPALGSAGFDLYEDTPNGSVFLGSYQPAVKVPDSDVDFDAVVTLPTRRMRALTLNFPLYNGVAALQIGLRAGARLEAGAPYRPIPPVIYYGSSITQGGCASRPGTCYQAFISRRFNCDYRNLGFSGSARGEQVMADYLARQKCSVMVLDYDHNAPSVAHLAQTHEPLYRTIRAAQPDLPIVLVSRPGEYDRLEAMEKEEVIPRRNVVHQTFLHALADGDRKIVFVDGESLFAGLPRGECTVDGCHPNDLGFYGMANAIGEAIARFLPVK